ncbi:hypothetical protein [Bradyrhizobium sp. CCBAU 53421]|uniref:hypothetical protein n=1 Tax=Bradyrhizobium sp. CCBAU 53421 TaxID=1325120 RepID=UPI00188BDBCB|nr:hypothetical protein [Bradyrhizobium sp. CCBAU 53421]QOZ37098.1 hypothetical protein XH92_40700 [Bradyrhizobium sp. CCBAU 53421]
MVGVELHSIELNTTPSKLGYFNARRRQMFRSANCVRRQRDHRPLRSMVTQSTRGNSPSARLNLAIPPIFRCSSASNSGTRIAPVGNHNGAGTK